MADTFSWDDKEKARQLLPFVMWFKEVELFTQWNLLNEECC